jgi:hypothetical protein
MLFKVLREYGAGETPQALRRRGGFPARPRKAKHLERKSTGPLTEGIKKAIFVKKDGFFFEKYKGFCYFLAN